MTFCLWQCFLQKLEWPASLSGRRFFVKKFWSESKSEPVWTYLGSKKLDGVKFVVNQQIDWREIWAKCKQLRNGTGRGVDR